MPGCEIEVEVVDEWPALAWVAHHRRDEARIRLLAGPGVEHGPGWWCEAVWAGPFEDADFDRTHAVFGSGGRVRGDQVTFVPSAAVSDRLHVSSVDDGLVVSNSLPALLAHTCTSLTDDHDHLATMRTVRGGIDAYDREIPTTDGSITLVYHDNLVLRGGEQQLAPKPVPPLDTVDYATYTALLRDSLRAIAANAASPRRARPLALVSTCSSGYDSSVVTALSAAVGCRHVVGIVEDRKGRPDSGRCVADALGMEFHGFGRHAWTERGEVETRFLAAGLAGGSTIPLLSAEPVLEGAVLLTGYHGDRMWDVTGEAPSRHHARADLGGTDLMEFRLSAGFVHAMVPFIGSAVMPEVRAISGSEEMAPWRLGSSYDRPIVRRLLEEEQVPLRCLADRKRAMQQRFPVNPATRDAFESWRAEQVGVAAGFLDDRSHRANDLFRWSVERERRRYAATT